MPSLSPELAVEFVEAAGGLLQDAHDLTSGDNGEYMRDGNPSNPFQAIPLAAARQGCRRYADNPNNYTAARTARTERACRPYLDSLEYGDPPSLLKPFEGGQCAAGYRVFYSWRTVFTDGSLSPGRTDEFASPPGGFTGPIRAFTFQNQPGNSFMQITYGPNSLVGILRFSPASQGAFAEAKLDSVLRLDGQPDSCGSPPPIYTPPKPPTIPGPVREPFTISPNINIDIGVEFNIDGSIDIDIGTGPITIDPFADPPTDGGEDPGGDGPDPGDVGEPGDGGFAGPGGDAAGEAPPGTVLTGLRMVLGNRPDSPTQYKAGIFRGSAYIYMGTAQGLDLDFAGQMLAETQFVLAKIDNLTHWKVSANAGYSWAVTPFYREV